MEQKQGLEIHLDNMLAGLEYALKLTSPKQELFKHQRVHLLNILRECDVCSLQGSDSITKGFWLTKRWDTPSGHELLKLSFGNHSYRPTLNLGDSGLTHPMVDHGFRQISRSHRERLEQILKERLESGDGFYFSQPMRLMELHSYPMETPLTVHCSDHVWRTLMFALLSISVWRGVFAGLEVEITYTVGAKMAQQA